MTIEQIINEKIELNNTKIEKLNYLLGIDNHESGWISTTANLALATIILSGVTSSVLGSNEFKGKLMILVATTLSIKYGFERYKTNKKFNEEVKRIILDELDITQITPYVKEMREDLLKETENLMQIINQVSPTTASKDITETQDTKQYQKVSNL